MGGPQEASGKGLGTSIQTLLALFYTDDRLVASSESASIQVAFDALTSLFDRVGLRTNEGKTVSMSCLQCRTSTHGQLSPTLGE